MYVIQFDFGWGGEASGESFEISNVLVICGESFEISNALVIYFTCTEKQSLGNYIFRDYRFFETLDWLEVESIQFDGRGTLAKVETYSHRLLSPSIWTPSQLRCCWSLLELLHTSDIWQQPESACTKGKNNEILAMCRCIRRGTRARTAAALGFRLLRRIQSSR